MISSPTPTLSLLATVTPPPSSPQPDPTTPEPSQTSTAILLTLIRLLPQHTDLILTVNIPLHQPPQFPPSFPSSTSTQINGDQPQASNDEGVINEEINFQTGTYGALVREGLAIREQFLRSLVVRDWGLFEDEGA
ncbi:hypothetical protein MMC07_000504 [Pseudocyphellaria aurata]|nr:hypothetical protein [Pseudocyphellaria aurata]